MTDTPDRLVNPATDDPREQRPGPDYEAPPGYQFQERHPRASVDGAAPNPAATNFQNYSPDAANESVPDSGPVTAQWPILPSFPDQSAYQPPTSYPPLANYPPPGAYPPVATYAPPASYPPSANYAPPASYPPSANYAPPASYPPSATYPAPTGAPYGGPAPFNLNLESQFSAGHEQRLPDGRRVARYGRRVTARLIDTAIAVAMFFTLNAAARGAFVLTTVSGNTSTSTLTSSGWTAVIAIGFVLEVVTVGLFGGQLGKLVMGIRLANARTLARIGWPAAILRWVISTVAVGLCFLPGLLMMLSPLWNQPWRRGWHDRISSTIVIEN